MRLSISILVICLSVAASDDTPFKSAQHDDYAAAMKAVAAIKRRVKDATKQGFDRPLADLLKELRPVLRGWAMYFRHGVSKATFGYLFHYTWKRVGRWMRRKHPHVGWRRLQQRYTRNGWMPEQDGITLFNPASVPVVRYRYRGALISTPWSSAVGLSATP